MKFNLEARSRDEMNSKICCHYLDIINNQSHFQTYEFEDRSICILLGCINDLIKFPLILEGKHKERPDFVVQMADLSVGIEVTMAANKDFMWAISKAKDLPDAVLEPSIYTPENLISREGKRKPLVSKINQPLQGPGWRGEEVENQWSTYVSNSIEGKTAKLSEESFCKYNENWLLICDLTPVRMLLRDAHLDVGMKMLASKLGKTFWEKQITFDKIFIECTNHQMVLMEKTGWRKMFLPPWVLM